MNFRKLNCNFNSNQKNVYQNLLGGQDAMKYYGSKEYLAKHYDKYGKR